MRKPHSSHISNIDCTAKVAVFSLEVLLCLDVSPGVARSDGTPEAENTKYL